jgi:precorrin-6A/cobalt-precorrin-6A reductase
MKNEKRSKKLFLDIELVKSSPYKRTWGSNSRGFQPAGAGENMYDVMVIAGTADARQVIQEILKLNIRIAATVTTKLGNESLPSHPDLRVFEGKLTCEGMVQLMKDAGVICLVDASHPFAREASVNAMEACRQADIPYLRYERAKTEADDERVIRVPGFKEAGEQAAGLEGNILFAAGSNQLEIMTSSIPDYRTRLFVRVLPDSRMIARCEAAGLTANNILAMKGPFTIEMNMEMLKYCKASILITKDSGETGGTQEKLEAAFRLGVRVIMVERPKVDYPRVTGAVEEVVVFVREMLSGKGR